MKSSSSKNKKILKPRKTKKEPIYQISESFNARSQIQSSSFSSSFQPVPTTNNIQSTKPNCEQCPSFRWKQKEHPSYDKIKNSKNKNFIKHFMLKLITQGFTKQQINRFFLNKCEESSLIDAIQRCVKEHKKKYKYGTQKIKRNWNNNLQSVKNFFLIQQNFISEPEEKNKTLTKSEKQLNQSDESKNSGQKKAPNKQKFVGNLNPLNLIDQNQHKLYSETMRRYADRSIREVMIPSAVENDKLIGIKNQTIYSLLFEMHRTRSEELMLHSKIINPQ